MNARMSQGKRWFGRVSVCILSLVLIKILFAFSHSNPGRSIGETVVAMLGAMVIIAGPAFLLGWLNARDKKGNPKSNSTSGEVTHWKTEKAASIAETPFKTNERTDESLWAKALVEFDSNKLRPGLWAEQYSKADGDIAKAKAMYLRMRVDELRLKPSNQGMTSAETNVNSQASTIAVAQQGGDTTKTSKSEAYVLSFIALVICALVIVAAIGVAKPSAPKIDNPSANQGVSVLTTSERFGQEQNVATDSSPNEQSRPDAAKLVAREAASIRKLVRTEGLDEFLQQYANGLAISTPTEFDNGVEVSQVYAAQHSLVYHLKLLTRNKKDYPNLREGRKAAAESLAPAVCASTIAQVLLNEFNAAYTYHFYSRTNEHIFSFTLNRNTCGLAHKW